jgi:hypothetical protein
MALKFHSHNVKLKLFRNLRHNSTHVALINLALINLALINLALCRLGLRLSKNVVDRSPRFVTLWCHGLNAG